jgi:hypothetical protein
MRNFLTMASLYSMRAGAAAIVALAKAKVASAMRACLDARGGFLAVEIAADQAELE